MNKYEIKDSKVEVLKATPEDARGIQEVFYQTWLATYPNKDLGITEDDIHSRFKDRLTEEGLKERAQRIAEQSNNKLFLVAKAEGKVVGACIVSKEDDFNQLEAIYVLPDFHGKGVGYTLWQEALKFFDPGKGILVIVAAYNQKAIDFYKRLGFIETGKCWSDEKSRLKSGAIIPEMEMKLKT